MVCKFGISFSRVLLEGSSHDLEVVINHGDRKSPKDRVIGPLPNGLKVLYMGVILTTYKSWDDPSSIIAGLRVRSTPLISNDFIHDPSEKAMVLGRDTPWKFNIVPEHLLPQTESSLPTIIFHGLC